MTSIFDPEHPHYEVHKAFIEGSFANPKNPPQVEWSSAESDWHLTDKHSWNESVQYRIKPRMLTRTVTYPEPLREEPAKFKEVWFVMASYKGPGRVEWFDIAPYKQTLNNGMCFKTEADAQACYDAIFGEQK